MRRGSSYLLTHFFARAQVSSWHKGEAVRRRSDSVRYVRYFCRADEATAMPLDDPLPTMDGIGISPLAILFKKRTLTP
jgi:hypothetical protein